MVVYVYTHIFPDLDAVASIWAFKKFNSIDKIEIKFVPANFSKNWEINEIGLDLLSGIKGEKSAFSEVLRKFAPLEDQNILKELSEFIDFIDSGGNIKDVIPQEFQFIVKYNLSLVFRAIQKISKDEFELIEKFSEILDGIYEIRKAQQRAMIEANSAEKIGSVAILRNSKEIGVNGYLFSQGFRFVIYIDEFNMGIVRANDCSVDLRILRDVIDEEDWFFHPSGFLAARGTRKAPAKSESKYSSGGNLRKIIDKLNEL